MFAEHKEMILEISIRTVFGKFTNIWKLKKKIQLLNNQWIKEEITREIRK